MRKLNATEKKILRTMKPGTHDSQASLSELTKIRMSIVGHALRNLVRSGYVRLAEKGYALTAKGASMAQALHAMRQSRRP